MATRMRLRTRRRKQLKGLGDASGFVVSPFRSTAEDWRPLLIALAGDLPTDFLVAWVDTESGGNPCDYTSLRESGISQLMYPDNLNTAGTTEADQHPVPPCVSGTRSIATYSSLTPAQQNAQVQGMVNYVNAMRSNAHSQLNAVGANWAETDGDFWRLVKMNHVAPATIPPALSACTNDLGIPCPDWNNFYTYAQGNGVPPSWLNNAEKVGAWGASDASGSIVESFMYNTTWQLLTAGLVTAAAGLAYWWFRRKSHKRVGHPV